MSKAILKDNSSSTMTADDLRKFSAGIAAFRKRFNLSIREMAVACGGAEAGVSKATAERLINGDLNIAYASKIKTAVIQSLSLFLQRRGLSETEVASQLKTISTGEEYQAMISPRTTLPPDVARFFGLRRDPFTSAPRAASEVFTTPALDNIAAQIEDAINYQGFAAVVGDIGSGKSLLKQRTMDTVEKSGGKIRLLWPEFFEMERVQAGAIVSFVLESFDQKPRRSLVAAREQLRHLLAHLNEQGIRVAIGFDECHHLSDTTLSALKNFWELGSGGYQRYLGVVLFGQPLFKSKLNDYRFREIAERVEVIEMPALAKHAWDYVAHRVKTAGGDAEKIFERDAIKRLSEQATTPLALGNLANNALLKAYQLGEQKVLAAFIETKDGEPRVRSMRRA